MEVEVTNSLPLLIEEEIVLTPEPTLSLERVILGYHVYLMSSTSHCLPFGPCCDASKRKGLKEAKEKTTYQG